MIALAGNSLVSRMEAFMERLTGARRQGYNHHHVNREPYWYVTDYAQVREAAYFFAEVGLPAIGGETVDAMHAPHGRRVEEVNGEIVHQPVATAIPEGPRTLRDLTAIEARQGRLSEPHIAPLTQYVARLRAQHPSWEFPDFDPLDGGIEAELLFLLEKPGPVMSPTHIRKGSGFISRDNNDSTAEATFCFMSEARIDRKRVVLWNVIPGWNGQRKIAPGEVDAGVKELSNLLKLLPRVHTVVLVGNKAQKAESAIRRLKLCIRKSAHPGPLVKGPNRALWDRIAQQWAEAALPPTEDHLQANHE
ncbi:hypothetical protein SAMN05445504_7595 [Burkholderia sp. CF099]|nr:hypothetical protein SAMN05445504_7595 [Burkholderia sp. CF099]